MKDSTIDRPARDALAALIERHLQGEICTLEAHQEACDHPLLADTRDGDILALADAVEAVCSDLATAPETIGKETRAWLARAVVFLRSDLCLRRVERSDYHPRQAVGGLGVVLVGIGAAAAIVLGNWIPFAVCWAVAGTLAMFYQRLGGQRPPAEVEALGRWAPFLNQADFRKHARLLANAGYLLALAEVGEEEVVAAPRIGLSWFLFGPLYGTLYLPSMLRCEHTSILLAEEPV